MTVTIVNPAKQSHHQGRKITTDRQSFQKEKGEADTNNHIDTELLKLLDGP